MNAEPHILQTRDSGNDNSGNRNGSDNGNGNSNGNSNGNGNGSRNDSDRNGNNSSNNSNSSGNSSNNSNSSGSNSASSSNSSGSNSASGSNSPGSNSASGSNSPGSNSASNTTSSGSNVSSNTNSSESIGSSIPNSSGKNFSTSVPTSALAGGPLGFPGCLYCVPNSDSRILYSGVWFLSGSQVPNMAKTTNTTGSSISLKFNGSAIMVFGTVHAAGNGNPPPTVTYSVGSSSPYIATLPAGPLPISNQPLYSSPILSPAEHELKINVTVPGAPFSLNYFYILPHYEGSLTDNKAVQTPSSATADSSQEQLTAWRLTVVVALLSALIGVLIVGIGFLGYHLRKRRPKKWKKGTSDYTESGRSRKYESMFTSTASMLRGTSYLCTSQDGRNSLTSLPPVPPKSLN